MISTRGRYALRVMIDLAQHQSGSYIPMKEVSKRQEISLKYIERIMPVLTKNKLVETLHGKGGGYKLCRAPEQYTVGEILEVTEEDLAPVACLQKDAKPCVRASVCKTLPMWKTYYKMTKEYFYGIKLSDLAANKTQPDYVI